MLFRRRSVVHEAPPAMALGVLALLPALGPTWAVALWWFSRGMPALWEAMHGVAIAPLSPSSSPRPLSPSVRADFALGSAFQHTLIQVSAVARVVSEA